MPSPAVSADGRSARAERTRGAVVTAMLALMDEGDLRPTAPRIAERAGVALRTVFHHFEDMEALFAEAADVQFRHLAAITQQVDAALPLASRIDAFVASRTSVHEAVSPVRRAALLQEPFSPEITRRLGWIRRRNRTEAQELFADALDRFDASARRDVAHAVAVASSWHAWEVLRTHQGCSPAQARRVIARTIGALLKEDPA